MCVCVHMICMQQDGVNEEFSRNPTEYPPEVKKEPKESDSQATSLLWPTETTSHKVFVVFQVQKYCPPVDAASWLRRGSNGSSGLTCTNGPPHAWPWRWGDKLQLVFGYSTILPPNTRYKEVGETWGRR